MEILMCKNQEVYDIGSQKVLNFKLLPGSLQVDSCYSNFKSWCSSRYSLKSNALARVTHSKRFPYSTRQEIDRVTGAFSLSDCYWIKTTMDQDFYKLTPYIESNWSMGETLADIYTDGWQSKKWVSPEYLYKHYSKIEIEAVRLARLLLLTTISVTDSNDGIVISNFTNINTMFEPADLSAEFYEDTLLDTPLPLPSSVVSKLGDFGRSMLVFDMIIGNSDRHLGNFGFLRSSDSGEMLGVAPLFDFDHAGDSYLSEEFIKTILTVCSDPDLVLNICNTIIGNTMESSWKVNAVLVRNMQLKLIY